MSIKGYWKFEGNSNDLSGNGLNGTDTNITYSQSAGRLNRGASFNGTSSRILIPGTIGDTKNAAKSFGAWVKIGADLTGADTYPMVFFIQYGTTNAINYAIQYMRIGGVNMLSVGRSRANISNEYIPYNNPTAAFGWYHVVGTFDGSGTLKMYVNGNFHNSRTVSLLDGTGTHVQGISFGDLYSVSHYYFNGSIDEAKIWTGELSPAQVKNDYSRIKGFF